ncbi:hypothetical protein GCM10022419_027670 [Nonomuraea rosea]|uniref:Aminoglycoside phosphotransferase domain-containing protein n=1 Tax=Nonomuraea rosea TaxID=638574 RepID=A0ABP6W7W6_9ACTN
MVALSAVRSMEDRAAATRRIDARVVGVERILEAASAALGEQVSRPIDLGGSTRSSVLRCVTADGGTVVVKAYQDAVGFAAEVAGLPLGGGYGPRLLAVDPSFPLVVMSDLGAAPSLADVLLGESAREAREGLLTWARTYGRIAVAGAGRQDEWERSRAAHAEDGSGWRPFRDASDLAEVLPLAPPGLDGELAELVASYGRYRVFSPGDICPDNNLLTADGMRVLDFEGSGYHSAFLEAAYVRMPFATCWCVFRLPSGLAAEIEAAYRKEVIAVHPDLADDRLWETGVRLAMVTWTIHMTWVLLPRARKRDRPMHHTRTPVPSERQLLRYRWSRLLAELDRDGSGFAAGPG